MAANTVALADALDPIEKLGYVSGYLFGPPANTPFKNPHHWQMNASGYFEFLGITERTGTGSKLGLYPDPGNFGIGNFAGGVTPNTDQDTPQYGMPVGAISDAMNREAMSLGVYPLRTTYGGLPRMQALGFTPEHVVDPLRDLNPVNYYNEATWFIGPDWSPGPDSGNDLGSFWFGQSSYSLFKYMKPNGRLENANYDGSSWTLDTNQANGITINDLFLLANNISWCFHNLHSFMAMTDILSGASQYTDRSVTSDPARPLDAIIDGKGGSANYGGRANTYYSYVPAFVAQYPYPAVPMIELKSLTSNYDSLSEEEVDKTFYTKDGTKTANTLGITADDAVFMSLNATSVSIISNNAPFFANSLSWIHPGFGGNDPTMNCMAKWLFTANGSTQIDFPFGVLGGPSRPAGFGTDHPATSMTVKEVYTYFLNAVNNYTYLIRSYVEADTVAFNGITGNTTWAPSYAASPGDYDPNPGVIPANTFIMNYIRTIGDVPAAKSNGGPGVLQDAIAEKTRQLQIIDTMSRLTLPGGTSDALSSAIANT